MGVHAAFAPASSGFVVIPNIIQVAAAAGRGVAIVSEMGRLQRAVSRLASVHGGRC